MTRHRITDKSQHHDPVDRFLCEFYSPSCDLYFTLSFSITIPIQIERNLSICRESEQDGERERLNLFASHI